METWVKNKGRALGKDPPMRGQNQGGSSNGSENPVNIVIFLQPTRRQIYSVNSHEMSQGSIRMEGMVGKGLERVRYLLGVGLECCYGHHCYYPCFAMICLSV